MVQKNAMCEVISQECTPKIDDFTKNRAFRNGSWVLSLLDSFIPPYPQTCNRPETVPKVTLYLPQPVTPNMGTRLQTVIGMHLVVVI